MCKGGDLSISTLYHFTQDRSVTTQTGTYYTVNAFFGFTDEGSCFAISAVVLVTALNAISWQVTAQTPTGTLGRVALFI